MDTRTVEKSRLSESWSRSTDHVQYVQRHAVCAMQSVGHPFRDANFNYFKTSLDYSISSPSASSGLPATSVFSLYPMQLAIQGEQDDQAITK